MKKIALVIPLLLLAGILAACQPADVQQLDGTDREAILAYSEPMADNLLMAINENNFANFSRDFDLTMAKAMDETAFAQIQDQILPKVGKYISRTIGSVESSGKYRTVIYNAVFEQDDPVTIRLVFNTDEENKITGLWFDSPKLRK